MFSATGACTMVGTQQAPRARPSTVQYPTARDPGEVSGSEAARITAQVVEIALGAIGTPYEWGGTDENGFDCSGLIQYAYGLSGIAVPRVSSAQIEEGSQVPLDPDRLRPGDILGFALNRGGKTSHVGLYVGGDEFIHSSSSGVEVSNIRSPYWSEHLVAARRIVR